MVAAGANGVLVYGTGRLPNNVQLLWLDRKGKPLGPAGPVVPQVGVALSPDGRQISVTRSDQNLSQVWLGEATGGAATGDNETRFTNEPLGGSAPVWSPDGKIVVFTGIDGNLYRKDASGGGNEELLLKSGSVKRASDWSRDGRFLLYTEERRQHAGGYLGAAESFGRGRREQALPVFTDGSRRKRSADFTRRAMGGLRFECIGPARGVCAAFSYR